MWRNKFTFMVDSEQGFKFSKIDRILVCHNFLNRWPQAIGRVLPKEKSDHCPLLLSIVDSNFGPKPFRWYNSWLDRDGCEDIIVNILDRGDFLGSPDDIISAKFKAVREALKAWRKEMCDKEGQQLIDMQEEINKLERRMEEHVLEEEDLWIYEELKASVGLIDHRRALDIKQKSRVQWAINGDENSGFFHCVVNGRKAKNHIPGLMVNGAWVTKPSLVKKHIFQFFRDLFSSNHSCRPPLFCDNLKKLTEDAKIDLVANFSREEIKKAVFECGSDKAPGPDGFNFSFLKHFWTFFEDDFVNLMADFHNSGHINHGYSAAFITLIPKIKNLIAP